MFEFLDQFNVTENVAFELSLARGLDYYTGCVYEAVCCGQDTFGSIAGGGRYDNLVGIFSSSDKKAKKGKKGEAAAAPSVPCVGASIGIERLFALLEARMQAAQAAEGASAVSGPLAGLRPSETQVFVVAVGKGASDEQVRELTRLRLRMASQLWAAGIAAEFAYSAAPTMKGQLKAADTCGCPVMVTIGQAEMERGVVQVKDMRTRQHG
eukprot:gnl/Ergobibamus_cyprinoides/1532.p1 GENE.gnl/Ergobibamus_cyprinoides/1532~~gnl/Ergobibamus_cyprinoides/1532.p1  ORF type:complete len:247 (-),score=82.35 gnl/Ergobibamus_cyprinoides/1532:51-680(-)